VINPLYQRCRFLASAAALRDLPDDEGAEVAFAGRSNAGKSSAINAITGQKGLARTSKTPGRTQLINFFTVDAGRRLVDLPGYGYAKVAAGRRNAWHRLVDQYATHRRSLRGIILVMDIRHPLTTLDALTIDWCRGLGLPTHLLLTKADKLGRSACNAALLRAKKIMQESSYGSITMQVFSSHERLGVEQAHRILDQWLDSPTGPARQKSSEAQRGEPLRSTTPGLGKPGLKPTH
jgi:GTP-binding protein